MTVKDKTDDTASGILKDKPDEAYRRLQQGFEAFRPAFRCNYKVNPRRRMPGAMER
jgi:hypothetical protein